MTTRIIDGDGPLLLRCGCFITPHRYADGQTCERWYPCHSTCTNYLAWCEHYDGTIYDVTEATS
jgi:hypothetical protein